jgi:hypothetical protein
VLLSQVILKFLGFSMPNGSSDGSGENTRDTLNNRLEEEEEVFNEFSQPTCGV